MLVFYFVSNFKYISYYTTENNECSQHLCKLQPYGANKYVY